MKAKNLMELFGVSAVGASVDWDAVERALGFSLPNDYKDICETFGVGDFGVFSLFHPNAVDEDLRMPEAVFATHQLLAPVSFAEIPTAECAVLGRLGGRKFLTYGAKAKWCFFDSEDEAFERIAEDLIEFLNDAFSGRKSVGSVKTPEWREIVWGSPFPVLPFFEPRE